MTGSRCTVAAMSKWSSSTVYPVVTTALFAAAIAVAMALADIADSQRGSWPFVPKALIGVGFIVLAGWFLHAFTNAEPSTADAAARAEQRVSMFRFAYLFSALSFALLVLPFTAMLRTGETPPDAGPIRLLRACVVPSPAGSPASGVRGPVDLCPSATTSPDVTTVTYPWLVSIGGVVAYQCQPGGFNCAKAADPMASSPRAASAPASSSETKEAPLYAVHGGLIVPFYVVVFAFVGGVVNLTRRVPEYQKRSADDFPGSTTETKVTLLEAREFVIFQLMQLVASPFVAMVAYYAIEPRSIASAVGLGFVSGFATESVLLLIRGVVNGLKPELTAKTAATAPTTQARTNQS